ncbi:MAG: potassium transporter Kup [Pseudomonadota bacterium]
MSDQQHSGSSSHRTATLTLAATGVVYGDVGTSPLYTMREIFNSAYGLAITPENVIGGLSLVIWTMTLVVSIKYVIFVMQAHNRGEGGIMALMALVLSKRHRRSQRLLIMYLGLMGAALFYGDGIITPAISVLSAMEGIEVIAPAMHEVIVPASIVVIALLFAMQSWGSGRVGFWFGPVMVGWFLTLAWMGFDNLERYPGVVEALNPLQALDFFMVHKIAGFWVLGAVVLCVTGGEALYADMGHFGSRPIRLAWFLLVFPSLTMNYLGQGALILENPEAIANPFFNLADRDLQIPLLVLATLATVIASQAVISGAFSMTRQAIQLDFMPRQRMVHTSAVEIGQVFLPGVNLWLMVGVMGLILAFHSSSNLAAAYGFSVTGTMLMTTMLITFVAKDTWKWKGWQIVLVMGGLMLMDLALFSANAPKIPQGGWMPMLMAVVIFTIMFAWKLGREVVMARLMDRTTSLREFLLQLEQNPPLRVPGTAVFMTTRFLSLPPALLRNYEHNRIIHEQVVLLTIHISDIPYVRLAERVSVEQMEQNFYRVTAHFGFMELTDVQEVLRACANDGLRLNAEEVTFFVGRELLLPSPCKDMGPVMERLFISLARNASSPLAYFNLPPERVVELGTVIFV